MRETTAALSGDTNPWALLALRFTSFQKDSVLQQRIWDHRFLAVSIAESINFFASDRPYSGQQPCGQSIHLRSPYQERKRRVNGMTRSTMVRSSAPVCSWPFGPTPTCRRRIADTLRRGPGGPKTEVFCFPRRCPILPGHVSSCFSYVLDVTTRMFNKPTTPPHKCPLCAPFRLFFPPPVSLQGAGG